MGAAGLLALIFALLFVFRMVRNEGLNAPVPVDDSAAKQGEPFPDPPPANSKPSQPAKPEKRPPLNER
jgi:hypothetical protein